jgi:hypothetical protein
MTSRSFPLTGPISLAARLGHGSLSVDARDARDGLGTAEVTVTPRQAGSDIAERIAVELRGDTLYVTAPRQGGIFDLPFFGGRRDAVDVTVTVPSGTPAKVSVFTADVRITGRVGDTDISSGAAEITVEHVDGDLRLRSGSGSASVQSVTGSVESRSGSGSARFGTIGGRLNVGCGSGRLSADSVRGPVRARAGSGDAVLGEVHSDVDLVSGSGTLSIGLPPGRPVRLSVTTGSGQVRSEQPIEDAPRASGEPLTVRARAGSGDIHLFRAASGTSV